MFVTILVLDKWISCVIMIKVISTVHSYLEYENKYYKYSAAEFYEKVTREI